MPVDPPTTVEPFSPAHAAALTAGGLAAADLERARAAAEIDPTGVRIVLAGDAPVALAVGMTTAVGFRLLAVRWDPARGPRDVHAVLADVRRRFPGGRIEAFSRITGPDVELDTAREAAFETALDDAGFVIAGELLHFDRDLEGFTPAEPDPFTYRPAVELGRAALVALLGEIIPPAEQARRRQTAAERFQAFVGSATRGDQLDTSLWHVAELEGRPAGVVLGLRHEPDVGSLQYCGLLPAVRGRGLGAALHAHALDRLRRAGARCYRDATTQDNVAMQRVFARHGCVRSGGSRLWALARPAPAAHFDDFAALVAGLRAMDHEVAIRDPAGWLQLGARAGADEAVIDVVWLRDRELVQVVCVLPFEVPAAAAARCAAATNTANAALDVAGFAIDPSTGTLRYQLTVWLDERGRLSAHALRRAIATAVRTSVRSARWWDRVVRGDDQLQPPEALAWAAPWAE